jgi:hypothetical protein
MNNKYKITIKNPLIRPGIEIKTECSEKYVVIVLNKMMDLIRDFNQSSEKSGNNKS